MALAPEVQERIGRIEEELNRIDRDIRALRKEREEVLMSDGEYASYVEQYEAYYDDGPLPIRQYYQAMAELERLNQEHNKAYQRGGDYLDEFYDTNEKQMAQLERALAV